MSTTAVVPTVVEQSPISITVTENDLPEKAKTLLKAAHAGKTVYDGEERSVESMVRELLPTAIANRVSKILPEGFAIGEIGLKLTVDGKIFGCGVGGDVTVKLVPQRQSK